jgi:hypothetical protein
MPARLGAVALVALSLTACETGTLYQFAMRPGAVGYSDYRIEPGRYRINFEGGDGAPSGQVRDYVLLRAAQVTLRDGYDWFRISARDGYVAPPRSRGAISFGFGGASFGRGGVGLGVGTTVPIDGGPRVGRSIEIVTGHGPIPTDGSAYDARGVAATLGPRAAPPDRP